jgi:hypothetical protein
MKLDDHMDEKYHIIAPGKGKEKINDEYNKCRSLECS